MIRSLTLGHKLSLWSVALLAALAILMIGRHELSMDAARRARQEAPPAATQGATAPAQAQPVVDIGRDRLIIPVQGLEASDLVDTWGAARSEGRAHQGIDIMATQGTPVLAVADGRIAKFFDSERGGVTIYQVDEGENWIYYYAHLNARVWHLREGDQVRRGQVIGYVGSTGNATTPHLHFEIQRAGADGRWWRGEAINPYPFLRARRAPAN